ncbi:MAG: methyltransferase domain-containing protein [Verrucomicrobia bacterium]|nr:methyltransferase domain-containing protein [Verrucomicrobiota bacterium]
MIPTIQWDPHDYAASSSSQARWGRELMEGVCWQGDECVLDVGCGDGRLTAELARRVPLGRVLGIDSSPEMIAHARVAHGAGELGNLAFLHMDAASIQLPREYDVVLSNAALHWVADHQAFLRGAAGALRSGGRLVVSCGGKGNADAVFAALRAEMRVAEWRPFFRNLQRPYFFYSDDDYRVWLPAAGFRPISIRLAAKDALHDGVEAFAGWLRTTWMPYTHRVPAARRDEFIRAVIRRYLSAHPPDPTGAVAVRMVRLELDAVRI